MFNKLLKSLVLCLGIMYGYSQNYNMTNGTTITTCSGTFYDSGGATGNYGNAESMIYTICPPSETNSIQIAFTEMNLENNVDILYVYDGDQIGAPLLYTFTGTEIPTVFQATGNNPSGCLTFRFTSDTYNSAPGWAATISCAQVCQPINAVLASSTPTAINNVIQICKGGIVNLQGTAVFDVYDENATYEWDMGNGDIVQGQEISYVYPEEGIYKVNLKVTDQSSCISTNALGLFVQVAPDPDVEFLNEPEYVCFGEDATLSIGVTYPYIEYVCVPPVNEVTYLPDTSTGVASIYRTYIYVDCFGADQIIESANDILSVCMDIEHSFMGDLELRLIAPNGQSMVLKYKATNMPGGGGGGLHLGHPIDPGGAADAAAGPGIGETYCFTPDATVYIINAPTQPSQLEPGSNSAVPGNYMPSQPFTNLVGAPLNGVWTLEIIDDWASDNGYIFGWDINFDEDLVPDNLSMNTFLVDATWQENEDIVFQNGTDVVVRPTQAGQNCYTVELTDNFGCTYLEQICIEVTEEILAGQPRDLEDCISPEGIAEFNLEDVLVDISTDPMLTYSFHETEADARGNLNAISTNQTLLLADGAKTIWVRIHNVETLCNVYRSFDMIPKDCDLVLNPLADLSICEGEENSFDLTVYDTIVYNNNLDFAVTYHYSADDALYNVNAIPEPLVSNFVATDGQEIFVRVTNIYDDEIFETTSFKLWIHELPTAYPLPTVVSCEINGAGLATFDLLPIVSIANGGAPSLEVSFYENEAFAELGYLDSQLPLNYTGPAGTVYVRVYNPNTGCYIITPLTLQIVSQPVVTEIAPLVMCDQFNDGREIFNLEPAGILIAGNPLPVGVVITYHETMTDAELNQNAILDINNYQNITLYNQTLYVRVGYTTSSCSSIVPLQLQVAPTPAVAHPTPLVVCDLGNNSIETFDLTTKIPEILGDLNAANYTVTFYLTADNANAGVNAIVNPSAFSNQTSQIVFVRVEDNATGCFSVVSLRLLTNPVPVVPSVVPTYQMCDENNDGFAVFNLQSRIQSIVGTQIGLQVTFHYTAADAASGNAPLPLQYQNVVPNVQTIYVRVLNPSTGCYSVTTMDIRVSPNPLVQVPTTPYVICNLAGTGGFGTIDLTAYGDALVEGTGFTITYFETQNNAQNNVLPIASPFAYNNLEQSNPVIWLRIVNPETGCFTVYSITFQLIAAPNMPLTLPTITLCDNFGNTYDGITIFDLTQQNDLILAANGGNLDGFIIRYYTSEANALAGTNWIGDPTQYQNLSNPQTIWVTVENTSNPGGCTRMRSFEIAVNSSIFLTQPTPITVCESTLPNDGVELFDLTIRELQILGGVQTFATFKYYTSAYDRENDINEITNAEFYTSTSPNQTIYIKVIAENGCESLTTLQLRVLPLPEVVTTPTPLQACEVEYGEGVARFNLRDAQAEIGMEDVNLSYRYFLTYDEAVLNQGAIGTPTDHLSASGSVFVRISRTPATEPNCFVIVELPLIMNPLPAIGPMTPLLACEENTDGRFTFNLEDKNEEALAGQNENNFSVRYYLNEQNAELATNQLPFIYTNVIQEQQIIFVRVENKNTGCYSISELILRVEEEVKAFPPSNTVFCEMDYVNDGVTPMDLTVMDAEIISTQNAAPLAVRYYRADGTLIVDPTNYVGTNGEVITAEVYRDEEGYLCTGMVSFTIYTKAGAEIKEIPNGIICYNYRDNSIVEQSYTMDTGLPNTSDFTFVWTLNGNVVGTESTYTAVEAGTYTVTVTVNSTGCSNSRTIVVAEGPAISIDEIIYSESFEERMAIEVIAYGGNGVELEYALDEGPWQESGIFDDVTPGEHVVRVRVKGSELSCPAVEIIQVMSHPQFFTPNADGFNDTWNITSLKYQPEAKIYIFDRYGKLIKELSPSGPGWDGTFNGVPMPATDYWFKATYVDPQTGLQKEATGHFSLKR